MLRVFDAAWTVAEVQSSFNAEKVVSAYSPDLTLPKIIRRFFTTPLPK
jgi:hypothetical protein